MGEGAIHHLVIIGGNGINNHDITLVRMLGTYLTAGWMGDPCLLGPNLAREALHWQDNWSDALPT